MATMIKEPEASDIATIGRALRRRGWVVLLALTLVTGSALGFSLLQEKQYSASASLLFRDPALDQKLFGSTFIAPSTDPTREAATNVKLVSLEVVAQRTASRLGGGRSAGDASSKVAVKAEGQSDVVSIAATTSNPRFSARVANTFVSEYVAFRRNADRDKIREARLLVQRQLASLSPGDRAGSRGSSLSQRAEQLRILASLQTGNAEIVQRATPPRQPSSPKVMRNAGLGAVLGIMLGIALALVFERLDRRVREPAEFEEEFDLPLLAAIPESRALANSAISFSDLPVSDAESFRMLRARLRYFNVDRDIRSLLVTSAAPADGKTTVAWNLAAVAAATGAARVLFLEADLRRPMIARKLKIQPMPGLAEVLSHSASLEEAVQAIPIGELGNGDGLVELDVVVAGAAPPNPAELIESLSMAELIERVEAKYELVVIDSPPTMVVSDAIPLMRRVSGVVVVGRVNKTTRDAAANLRSQLTKLGAPALGIVANGVAISGAGYYGYGYGPAEASEHEQPARRV